jgi:hypothetical protein
MEDLTEAFEVLFNPYLPLPGVNKTAVLAISTLEKEFDYWS